MPNTTPESAFSPEVREELTQILTDWFIARWEARQAKMMAQLTGPWVLNPGDEITRIRDEARCRECSRHLTAATSISAGIGPVCRRRTRPS